MLDIDEKRKIRIMDRARSYAEGNISLRDFYDMEMKEGDDVREQERQKLREMFEEARKERLQREKPEPDLSEFRMSKEEFDRLPVYEQNKIYQDHPKEIRRLMGREIGSTITMESFKSLTTGEQNRLFRSGKVDELLSGKVDFVDVGEVF